MIKATLDEKNRIVLSVGKQEFILSQEEANRVSFELEVCVREADNASRGLCPRCKGIGDDGVGVWSGLYEAPCSTCNGKGFVER